MSYAARVQDPTGHGGSIAGPGVTTVRIGGQPAAVAQSSLHKCSIPQHPPSTFARGSSSVFIGGSPALRQGDLAGCMAPIAIGCPTVLIGG